MRRRARTDSNQEAIASALEKVGCQVERKLARLGDGVPDLLIGLGTKIFLLEVKMPNEKLTPKEWTWHNRFRVHIVHSVDEALKVVAVYASEVKR